MSPLAILLLVAALCAATLGFPFSCAVFLIAAVVSQMFVARK